MSHPRSECESPAFPELVAARQAVERLGAVACDLAIEASRLPELRMQLGAARARADQMQRDALGALEQLKLARAELDEARAEIARLKGGLS